MYLFTFYDHFFLIVAGTLTSTNIDLLTAGVILLCAAIAICVFTIVMEVYTRKGKGKGNCCNKEKLLTCNHT